jgi:hypothetical protein
VPLVSGAAIGWDAQISVYDTRQADAPLLRLPLPARRQAYEDVACATMGVFAPLVGIVGSVQAAEALKLLAGTGQPLAGRLLMLDARSMPGTSVRLPRQARCPVCSATPQPPAKLHHDPTSPDLTARNFPSAEEEASRALPPPSLYAGPESAYRLAFTDTAFLLREELRPVRMQLELLKPELVQQELGIESTIVIFGSARILPPDEAAQALHGAAPAGDTPPPSAAPRPRWP